MTQKFHKMLLFSCTFNCKILFTWKVKIPIYTHYEKIYTVQIEEDVFCIPHGISVNPIKEEVIKQQKQEDLNT